jgi:hypothetical protein
VSPVFVGCHVPVSPRQRTGESSASRRTALLKKNSPLAMDLSLGRNGKVNRFAAGLCVVIHTRRGKLYSPMRPSEIGPPGVEARRPGKRCATGGTTEIVFT